MKRLLIITAIFLFAASTNSEARYSEFRYGINFNYFYSTLEPHGEWIEIDYDVIVWRPYHVGRNWQPYTRGRWEWTSYGWYWDSYEPFGWATYHYGRWHFDDYYGWVWMPGYEWAPAWVEWRYSDDYIGWAPLSPYAAFDVHRGIYFSIKWHTRYNHWHFVSFRHFGSHKIYHHFVANRYKNKIFSRTKYRTNYYADNGRIINGGIDRNFVERKSGNRFKKREIQSASRVSDYSKSRNRSSDRIISYRPSTSEVRKYNNVKRDKIKIDRRTTTLNREKIAIKSRSKIDRNIDNNVKRAERNSTNKKSISDMNENGVRYKKEVKSKKSSTSRSKNIIKQKDVKKSSEPIKRKPAVKQKTKSSSKETYKRNSNTNKTKSSVKKSSSRSRENVKRESTNNSRKKASRSKTRSKSESRNR
jgi:hypothetical protein